MSDYQVKITLAGDQVKIELSGGVTWRMTKSGFQLVVKTASVDKRLQEVMKGGEDV